MRIGDNIKSLRKSRGLGGKDLAEMLGVTQSTISGYERGTREPSLSTVIAICDIFHVKAHDLLTADLTDQTKIAANQNIANEPEGEYQVGSSSDWNEHEIVAALKKIIHSLK